MSEAEAGLQDTPEPAGLDAILSSALEGYGDDPKPEVAAETTEAAPAAETKADHPSDPTRYADGTFKPTKSAEAKPSEPEPAAEAKPAIPAAVDPATVQPIDPHPRWSAELKADFAKWSPDVQKAFKDRYGEAEADYTRKTQELAETRKGIEPLLGEVQQLAPVLQRFGMTPHQFMRESAIVADRLSSGPPEQRGQALAYLAQLHQIPVGAVLQALNIPIPQVGHDGQLQPVDPAVSQLHQTVAGLQAQLRQMNEQRANEERQRAQAEFDALGQAKDQSGQPKFPHFERVRQAMIQLVASGQSDTWDDAYTKSVRLDDELYKQTVEAERARVAAEAEKQRLAAVEKAKKAQPVKSSDGARGAVQLKGLDAHIAGAMERAGFGD